MPFAFFFLIKKEDLKLGLKSYMVTLPPQKIYVYRLQVIVLFLVNRGELYIYFFNPLSSFTIVAINLLNVLVFKIEHMTSNVNPTFALNA